MNGQAERGRFTSPRSESEVDASFPIVGIGASAGGLEAFTQLLKHLPSDSGLAFVLIQHLFPTRESFLSAALASATGMTIYQAEDGMRVEPNHVYVIPPNADLAILRGLLTVRARPAESRGPRLPVDVFLLALAEERGRQAIGIVLSGNGSDGTEGLKSIRAADGITFAQDPESAKFDSMPRAAIDAGVVDYCLPIPRLADELLHLVHHPYIAARQTNPEKSDEATLNKIFLIIKEVHPGF